MPGIADNALVKAARLIERLADYGPEPRLEPEVAALFEALTGERSGGRGRGRSSVARAVHPLAGELVEPLVGITLSPTMISASQKRNVIPALCEVTVDCRLFPGSRRPTRSRSPRAARRRRLRARVDRGVGRHALADGGAALGRDRIRVAETEPGAAVAPICSPASPTATGSGTRSARSPTASSRCAYMDPQLAARLVHSADERVQVDDLELGVHFLRYAAQTMS